MEKLAFGIHYIEFDEMDRQLMLISMMAVYVSLIALMTFAWIWAMWLRVPSLVDLFWAPALFQSACIYIFIFDELDKRSFFILSLLALWVIRLTLHLYVTRARFRTVDARYTYLVKNARYKSLSYFFHFQLQAVFVFIIALPFYWISQQMVPEFDLLDYTACVTCLTGILGEAVADWQLLMFKKKFPQRICTAGLWYYSRHPNYFFNWLIWVGFGIYSISSLTTGYIGLVSPLFLYWMMQRFSIPITEKLSLQHKGEAYQYYQLTTPAFFLNVFKA